MQCIGIEPISPALLSVILPLDEHNMLLLTYIQGFPPPAQKTNLLCLAVCYDLLLPPYSSDGVDEPLSCTLVFVGENFSLFLSFVTNTSF